VSKWSNGQLLSKQHFCSNGGKLSSLQIEIRVKHNHMAIIEALKFLFYDYTFFNPPEKSRNSFSIFKISTHATQKISKLFFSSSRKDKQTQVGWNHRIAQMLRDFE
jgi:hypothetical protein